MKGGRGVIRPYRHSRRPGQCYGQHPQDGTRMPGWSRVRPSRSVSPSNWPTFRQQTEARMDGSPDRPGAGGASSARRRAGRPGRGGRPRMPGRSEACRQPAQLLAAPIALPGRITTDPPTRTDSGHVDWRDGRRTRSFGRRQSVARSFQFFKVTLVENRGALGRNSILAGTAGFARRSNTVGQSLPAPDWTVGRVRCEMIEADSIFPNDRECKGQHGERRDDWWNEPRFSSVTSHKS